MARLSLRLLLASVVFVGGLAAAELWSTPHAQATLTAGNVAEDNFSRGNTAAGWGTTTNSHGVPNYAWAGDLGTSPLATISGGNGTIAYTGTNGHKLAGYVASPVGSGGDALIEFSFSAVGHQQAGVILQRHGTVQWYQADLNSTIGSGVLQLVKRLNGKMNFVSTYAFAAAANTNYWIRLDVQAAGATEVLGARVWADGSPEPSTWQVTYADSAPLPAGYPGAMGDWFKTPAAGEREMFHYWAYANPGPATGPI